LEMDINEYKQGRCKVVTKYLTFGMSWNKRSPHIMPIEMWYVQVRCGILEIKTWHQLV